MKQVNTKKWILMAAVLIALTGMCGCAQDRDVEFVTAMDEVPIVEAAEESISSMVKMDGQQTGMDSSIQTDGMQDAVGSKQDTVAVYEKVPESEPAEIIVHVCGAVRSPGVYRLEENSRVIDAVNRAGGLEDAADSEFINLASRVLDGDRIWIPTKEEAALYISNGNAVPYITSSDESIGVGQGKQSAESGKVNINTADEALLCTLPGIGKTRASSIIAYREECGMFSYIEDIMKVSGIKDSSFQKIKEYITVN